MMMGRLPRTARLADESTPTRKAKPAGVMGAEIWVKVGDPPPTGPSELSFLPVDTRPPYVADYPGEDGGKTAHCMLRWPALDATARCQGVSTSGEKGPWSETASATIGA